MNVKDAIEMVKPEFGKLALKVGQIASNPNALTAATVVGIITTTGLGVRASFKAAAELEERSEDEELDIFDKLRITSKYYVGTAISAAATIGMAIASNRASAKQSVVVASSCALLQEAADKAEKKLEISEKQNEEKTKRLNEAMLKDLPPDRYMWCKDLQTGALFKTNKEILDQANGKINERFQEDRATTINDLYSMIGVDRIEVGDDHVITETNTVRPLDISPAFAEDGSVMLHLSYFQEALTGGYGYIG